MAFEDLRHALHGCLEFPEGFLGLGDKRHFDKELVGQTQRGAVEIGGVGGYNARLLQQLYPAMAGGRRQAGLHRQIGDRALGIHL